jgi:hypothetical protein
MQQTPQRNELDDEESQRRATRAAPPIPVWAIFFLAALVALALIYVMGLLAPTG